MDLRRTRRNGVIAALALLFYQTSLLSSEILPRALAASRASKWLLLTSWTLRRMKGLSLHSDPTFHADADRLIAHVIRTCAIEPQAPVRKNLK